MNKDPNQPINLHCRLVSLCHKAQPIPQADLNMIYKKSLQVTLSEVELSSMFPLPWDAALETAVNGVRIEGHAGPGGFGSARVTVPWSLLLRYLVVDVCFTGPEDEVLEDFAQINRVLARNHWALISDDK